MRTIITGGTGLIGRALASDLARDGHEIVVLSRRPELAPEYPPEVTVDRWDAETSSGWAHWVDGAAAIINLAGESIAGEGFFPSRWSKQRRRRILQSRIKAGQAIVQAAGAAVHKPGVLVQASAMGYYGARGDGLVDEESAPGKEFQSDVVVEWEASTAEVERMGVRRVILRTGLVLSPEGGALRRLLLPFRLFVGGPMGSGRQHYSWIHLDDLVKCIRFLMENEAASGPFNVTAPRPVTNGEMGRAIGRALRRPYYMPVPSFAMRAIFGEVATIVVDGRPVVPARLKQLGFVFDFPGIDEALADLIGKKWPETH
jgi:hypothetical protein